MRMKVPGQALLPHNIHLGLLESHTARLSEGLLQARETATQFLQKPNDKKVAAHEETIKAAIGHLGEIESIAGTLAEGDALRQALTNWFGDASPAPAEAVPASGRAA